MTQSITTDVTFHYVLSRPGEPDHAFEAIGDSQAIGLSEKQYPDVPWKLFRIAGNERVEVFESTAPLPSENA